MRLDPIDLKSSTWQKIVDHLEKRKVALMSALKNPELDHIQTQSTRAALIEVETMLKFGEVREARFRTNIQGGDEIEPVEKPEAI